MFLENFCVVNHCKNEGKCDNNIDGNGYECFCHGPYRGKNCEKWIYDGKLKGIWLYPGIHMEYF